MTACSRQPRAELRGNGSRVRRVDRTPHGCRERMAPAPLASCLDGTRSRRDREHPVDARPMARGIQSLRGRGSSCAETRHAQRFLNRGSRCIGPRHHEGHPLSRKVASSIPAKLGRICPSPIPILPFHQSQGPATADSAIGRAFRFRAAGPVSATRLPPRPSYPSPAGPRSTWRRRGPSPP